MYFQSVCDALLREIIRNAYIILGTSDADHLVLGGLPSKPLPSSPE
jgi:hypothetical protein